MKHLTTLFFCLFSSAGLAALLAIWPGRIAVIWGNGAALAYALCVVVLGSWACMYGISAIYRVDKHYALFEEATEDVARAKGTISLLHLTNRITDTTLRMHRLALYVVATKLHCKNSPGAVLRAVDDVVAELTSVKDQLAHARLLLQEFPGHISEDSWYNWLARRDALLKTEMAEPWLGEEFGQCQTANCCASKAACSPSGKNDCSATPLQP